jgi:hypothetical protein
MTNVRYLGSVRELAPGAARPAPAPVRARLTAWQRMQVEEARCLVMDAPNVAPDQLGPPRMAYLAGRLEGAAANLLSVLDAIAPDTEIGGETG